MNPNDPPLYSSDEANDGANVNAADGSPPRAEVFPFPLPPPRTAADRLRNATDEAAISAIEDARVAVDPIDRLVALRVAMRELATAYQRGVESLPRPKPIRSTKSGYMGMLYSGTAGGEDEYGSGLESSNNPYQRHKRRHPSETPLTDLTLALAALQRFEETLLDRQEQEKVDLGDGPVIAPNAETAGMMALQQMNAGGSRLDGSIPVAGYPRGGGAPVERPTALWGGCDADNRDSPERRCPTNSRDPGDLASTRTSA